MDSEPLVSVVMPAYNSAAYIGAAIESVLAQTYPHFELLIINDGSVDPTPEILDDFARRDSRLCVIHKEHSGLTQTLNYGLQQARGKYLARLDADDLAVSTRLEVQVTHLESQPDVVIVGSAYTLIGTDDAPIHVERMPESDTAIRWHALFHSPFAHSSVMLRLELLRANGLTYDPEMKEAEDYDLWSRLLQHGRGCNLKNPLVLYRQHTGQASQQGQLQVWDHASRIAQRNLIEMGMPLPVQQVSQLRQWYYHFPMNFVRADLPQAEAFLAILNRFSLQLELDEVDLARLRGRWLGRLLRASLRSRDISWGVRLALRLKPADLRVVALYLLDRNKLGL